MPGSWGQRPWSRDHEGGKREVFWERGSLLLVNNLVFLQKQENSQMSFRGQFQHLIPKMRMWPGERAEWTSWVVPGKSGHSDLTIKPVLPSKRRSISTLTHDWLWLLSDQHGPAYAINVREQVRRWGAPGVEIQGSSASPGADVEGREHGHFPGA